MTRLEELIQIYALNKAELDSYDKLCKLENAEIKQLMLEANKDVVESGDWVAKRIVSTRETMNEDKLLQIAHLYGIPEIVKTKEYIDFDALEDAIYNGRISKDVLTEIGKTKESKEVVTLKVTKIKKKKGEE